jgi:hypothetical protein
LGAEDGRHRRLKTSFCTSTRIFTTANQFWRRSCATNIHHERHGTHFPAGTEDSIWLPFVGQKGWILLTKDKRIRFNDLEKRAVIANRVREFYFTSGNFNGEEMAELLVVALPEMFRLCRKHHPPFIASITKAGNVHIRLQAKND